MQKVRIKNKNYTIIHIFFLKEIIMILRKNNSIRL